MSRYLIFLEIEKYKWFTAAKRGDLAFLKLHRDKTDIDAQNENTALIFTAWCGHLKCVKYLVQEESAIETKSKYGWTPLM